MYYIINKEDIQYSKLTDDNIFLKELPSILLGTDGFNGLIKL